MPLQMFVFPAREDATLPEVFTKFAAKPTDPKTSRPRRSRDNREHWVETVDRTVLR